jgi:hypothetical protein
VTNLIVTPDPLKSNGEYNRYHHFDIPNLDSEDLQDELNALRPLLWGLDKNHWLRERVRLLEHQLARRRGAKWQ